MDLAPILNFDNGVALTGFLAGASVGLAAPLVRWYSARRRARRSHDVKHRVSLDTTVHDLLTELRLTAGRADRAILYQFHNGDNYFNGSPIQKISATHESAAAGIAPMQSTSSGIPASLYAPLTELMFVDRPVLHMAARLPDSHVKGLLLAHGVNAFLVLPLRQGKACYSGMVVLHWSAEPAAHDVLCDTTLTQTAAKIQAVLSDRSV